MAAPCTSVIRRRSGSRTSRAPTGVINSTSRPATSPCSGPVASRRKPFRSLLVYYDPLVVGYDALCEALAALAAQAEHVSLPPPRVVELPCCYEDPELGIDLVPAAERLGLPPAELAGLHAGAEYLVYFIGFTPGLPYMSGMPERIMLPRLETPRTKVPPGSVGIGGIQCCIYSVESPGGYWILGRTPLRLYDPEAVEPI